MLLLSISKTIFLRQFFLHNPSNNFAVQEWLITTTTTNRQCRRISAVGSCYTGTIRCSICNNSASPEPAAATTSSSTMTLDVNVSDDANGGHGENQDCYEFHFLWKNEVLRFEKGHKKFGGRPRSLGSYLRVSIRKVLRSSLSYATEKWKANWKNLNKSLNPIAKSFQIEMAFASHCVTEKLALSSSSHFFNS